HQHTHTPPPTLTHTAAKHQRNQPPRPPPAKKHRQPGFLPATRPETMVAAVPLLNHPPADMRRSAVATRCHADLAGVSFGVGNELGDRVSRHRWMERQYLGLAANAGDWRDVADEIEFVVEQRAGYGRCGDKQERITIRWRFRDRLCGDSGACAGPIFNDERLAKSLRHALTEQPC